MNRPTMTLCTRCVLPSTFPGISFDDAGTCNFCRSYKGDAVLAGQKAEYEKKFVDLLATHRRPLSYDVLMAYSGGKDSTYTLDVFVNRYGLRVLALTFDNTFVSPQSFVNMQRVCGKLGADHMIIRPAANMLRKIFREASQRELYSPKTLERASTICTSCIGLVKAVVLRTAIEKQIPFVGFGWSPGQAPVQSSVMKTNPAMARATQKAIYEPLHAIAGDAVTPYFVTEEQFGMAERFPWNVHPLAFLDYNEDRVIARNRELGWEKPDDTDPNSTNCLLNAFANQVHKDRYDFHPYAWEIANMVRVGVMTREEGREKVSTPENPDMVQYARQRLVPEDSRVAAHAPEKPGS
ncbi:MAG: hypothetical protein HZB55_17605 [Deltaproteobacteria bacterium]|nr:hypothetical protein [Deltaproteobacteria bacterium]